MPADNSTEQASFRDPAGIIFFDQATAYRRVNEEGRAQYDALMSSGLYEQLTAAGWLVAHEEVAPEQFGEVAAGAYKVLRPEQIDFISYPYEWSFSQLKDAALLTLKIQEAALERGLIMRDASAYNVQFQHGRPVFIDTLSFEPYQGQRAWQAYRQFCQQFLAPLAIMAYANIGLGGLTREFIDGVPLEVANDILPLRRRLRPGILLHIGVHSRSQKHFAGKAVAVPGGGDQTFAKNSLLGLVGNLRRTVQGISLPPRLSTEWGEYYRFTNYSDRAAKHKAEAVRRYVARTGATMVWDLGGNDGRFSRVAVEAGARQAVCFDIDPLAVEKNYRQARRQGDTKVLPLLCDLTNPSPALGWAHRERRSLEQRAGVGNTVMALALIHHLAISNNLPFDLIARYFARLGRFLIIEFVPKDDSMVQVLLRTREDIFGQYDREHFETAFEQYYRIREVTEVRESRRVLYLMERNDEPAAASDLA
jgi:hypothetical protein